MSHVIVRMVVPDTAAAVAFLRDVFGAIGDVPADRPADVRLGDSHLLISSASAEREVFPAFLYVYVDDVEDTHTRALAAGASEIEEPWRTPYGDFRSMVRDPSGNVFQLARKAGEWTTTS